MARLPVVSGVEAVKVFEKAGWTIDRQRGSHVILVKDGHLATLSVPDRGRAQPVRHHDQG
jgi:predicted RNA binding protein YcfA (HicA-like mRNA interferase family)